MPEKPEFTVTVGQFADLTEIPGTWQDHHFRDLLELMDYGATDELTSAELREMCLLCLQDLPPEEAAALVLRYRLSDELNPGQIQNIAVEMQDEKLWEEYADMVQHENMFVVGSLLYAAIPESFPEPDAVSATLHIQAGNKAARDILEGGVHESFLVRLIADGIDPTAPLHRLFTDQLAGAAFSEATAIVWNAQAATEADHVRVELNGSGAWLDSLRGTRVYTSNAHPDESA